MIFIFLPGLFYPIIYTPQKYNQPILKLHLTYIYKKLQDISIMSEEDNGDQRLEIMSSEAKR